MQSLNFLHTISILAYPNPNDLGFRNKTKHTRYLTCVMWAFGPLIKGHNHYPLVIIIYTTHLYGKNKGALFRW